MTAVINDFTFEGGSIFELKFTDAYGEKKDVYQWYLIYDGKRYVLNFVDQKKGIRILHNDSIGIIVLNIKELTLHINNMYLVNLQSR